MTVAMSACWHKADVLEVRFWPILLKKYPKWICGIGF